MAPKKRTEKKNDKPKSTKTQEVPDTTEDEPNLTIITQKDVKSDEIETPDYDKQPLCFDMPKIKKSIFDTEENVSFASNIDYPLFSAGFHHFIHQGKNYFGDTVKRFEGKKQVWRVMNKYETKIDNYDQSIADVTKDYFDLKGKPEILSRAFYKLWEILMSFDLIDLNDKNFVSAHLAEAPGGFAQATIMYRDMFSKNSKHDKYYGISLHPESGKSYVPEMDKKFIDYYTKESPKRLFLHKTYDKQTAGGDNEKTNGDLLDPKTMRLFTKQITGKCDIITADGAFENINENMQEQESFRLIFAEIINAVKIQKKGGHFICKFFETFTNTSMKIITILSEMYEEIQFVKPLSSRMSNSEKYAICMRFKYKEGKEFDAIMNTLENILETMHKNNGFVVGLFDKYTVPRDLSIAVTSMNILLSNLQIKNINEIVSFIRKEIYSGDEYYEKREEQIKANKYWIDLFYPAEKNFIKAREECKKLIGEIVRITNRRDKKLGNEIN